MPTSITPLDEFDLMTASKSLKGIILSSENREMLDPLINTSHVVKYAFDCTKWRSYLTA
jgi:hypothetical protein